MNKFIITLLTWCISSFLFAQFQTVDSSLRAKLTPDFEVFDSIYFKQIKLTRVQGRDTLVNGTTIIMANWSDDKSYEETPPSSYWSLFKYYYSNGYIQRKGLWYTTNSNFEIGTWYYFDEKGELTDSINYDQRFTFTFEQVLQFTKQERAARLKNLEEFKEGNRILEDAYQKMKNPVIGRVYYSETKKSAWFIRWDEVDLWRYYRVKLDGNTGEVISREYTDMPKGRPIIK